MSSANAYAEEVGSSRRFFCNNRKRYIVKVLPGGHYVSSDPNELISTILGSCVAACIWDPDRKVGGLNHFMLPHDDEGLWSGVSVALRYGNHAMDALINELLKLGADKQNLRCKFFGGGNVLVGMNKVGSKNSRFAKEYAAIEKLNVINFDLGGDRGRNVLFEPSTGRAWRKLLDPNAGLKIVGEETKLTKPKPAPTGSIELF